MGQFVDDEAIEQVVRLVHRHHDPLPGRFGKGTHPFLGGAGHDVLLLEFATRLEEDQRHLVREVVLELRTDVLVGALGVARHPFEMRLDFGVVVDDEVIRLVRPPLEAVVTDLILAEIRDIRRLCGDRRQRKHSRQCCGNGKAEPSAGNHGVSWELGRVGMFGKSGDLTADSLTLAMTGMAAREQRTYR